MPREYRDSGSLADHHEVINMIQQIDAYQNTINAGRSHMVRYREDGTGRPVRVMNQVISPISVRSQFDWDSSDDDEEEE